MVPGYGTGRTRVPYPGEPTHKIHWYSCSACTHGQLYGVYTQPYRGTRALNLVPCSTAVLNLVWYTKFSVYSSTRVLNLVAVQWRNVGTHPLHFYRDGCGIHYHTQIPGYSMDTDLGIFELCDIGTLFDPLSFFFRGTLESYKQITMILWVHP
jgi:hypothetical protein